MSAEASSMSPTQKLVAQFSAAVEGATKPERKEAAAQFAAAFVATGVATGMFETNFCELVNTTVTNASGKKGAAQREGAMYCVIEVCTAAPDAAMLMTGIFATCLDLQNDKSKPTAAAAKEATDLVFAAVGPNMINLVIPTLLTKNSGEAGNVDRFEKLSALCKSAPRQVAHELPACIPAVVIYMNELSKKVADAAQTCLKDLCSTCSNPDMKPFLGPLVVCMKKVSEIPETVFTMAACTFVAEVEHATLAIMAPVLLKGLATQSTTMVKRQCARIIENMCKLVEQPRALDYFTANIQPLLVLLKDTVSDPECRDVCASAVAALEMASHGRTGKPFGEVEALAQIKEQVGDKKDVPAFQPVFHLATQQFNMLNGIQEEDNDLWIAAVNRTLQLTGLDAAFVAAMTDKIREFAEETREIVEGDDEADDGAEVLCDIPFGLAYGTKVLLRKTRLKLLRGHRYGLLGKNDSGKTSLLNALADYKIDGFPTADQCRTVFVATDIKTDLADLSVIDYMYNDPLLQGSGIDREAMVRMLTSVGFKEGAPANTTQPVGTLSGGWRMKLALSRAMLLNADILLLDEPTNHLDAYNVKWVEEYLLSLKNVTSIMVSHDSGLLTRVCTDIMEINSHMKLKNFRGNLAAFVTAKPDAKHYFELPEEGKLNFKFPNPGALPGIKSKGKAIMKMTNIGFTYPGVKKAQLNNVTVQLALASRVAVVGENGAGKSTMIKLLTGELEPDAGSGDVWKHPNCRVGYIAQHAFFHIEKHLDQTANEYIRNRYAGGIDREETVKLTNTNTPEEEALMATAFEMKFPQDDGVTVLKKKVVVSRFTERRRENKKDRTVEYEVAFVGSDVLHYVDRDLLCKQGWEKSLRQLDERIAMRATTFERPLTKEGVQKHIAEVGLAPEFSTHMRMAALSGGQKVKVVLAAALWNQPHILILDEPTNYLDRESLGALARAIRAFEGGVVMITHNSQFCDNLCPVVWHLQNNTLDIKGDAEWMAEASKAAIKVDEIDESAMVDRFGNTVVIEKKKEYSKKELKQKQLRRRKRAKETGDDYDSDEE